MEINSMNTEELREMKNQINKKLKEIEESTRIVCGNVFVDKTNDKDRLWRLCLKRKPDRHIRKPHRNISVIKTNNFPELLPVIEKLIADLSEVKTQIEERLTSGEW